MLRSFSRFFLVCFLFSFALPANAIIVRHDVDETKYFELGEDFRALICNLNVNPKVPDCMATFLSKRWIITAAHCAVLIDEKMKKGAPHEIEFQSAFFGVEKVYLHPGYVNTRSVQDIALIKLKADVPRTKAVSVLTDPFQMRETIFVAGYGDTGTGKTGPTGNDRKLRAGTNRIDSISTEWVRFLFDAPESPNTTELEAISGPGDSGGPALVERGNKYFLVGISSRQSTRATGGKEGFTASPNSTHGFRLISTGSRKR
jgi:Trypsin